MRNKKVTVIGLGNSGLNAALLLKKIGAEVRVTEAANNEYTRKNAAVIRDMKIPFEIGCHTRNFISGSDLVVVSPGVENSSDPLVWAKEDGIFVIGEMELGYRFCKGRIIAITGTNGKSTVTALTGEILKQGGLDTVVCGNIGNSLSGEIGRIKKDTWVVIEVSSFQLERIEKFKPHVAIILNIRDDHLDRYKTFEDYFKEKLNIFKNQDDKNILILNRDAGELDGLERKARSRPFYYSRVSEVSGAFLRGDKLVCNAGGTEIEICDKNDIRLKGLHNTENVLVSCLAGAIAGVRTASIRDTVKDFKGLSHRFETIRIIDGVEYIDDSKGTTVDSTYRALESCKGPVILIAGGKDKNSDYTVIRKAVKEKVRHLILIGEARSRIRESLGDIVQTHEMDTLQDAVGLARRLSGDKYMVLLSPMCSSFDMFRDYKERGEVFKKAVLAIR